MAQPIGPMVLFLLVEDLGFDATTYLAGYLRLTFGQNDLPNDLF